MTCEPAFPVQDASAWQAHGMSMRDYFAASALNGFLANVGKNIIDEREPFDDVARVFAVLAYKVADAMLSEREDKEQ